MFLLVLCFMGLSIAQGSKKLGNTFRVDGFLSQDGKSTVISIQSASEGWAGIGIGGSSMADAKLFLMGWPTTGGKFVVSDALPTKGYSRPVYDKTQISKQIPLAVPKESWAKIAFSVERPVTAAFKFSSSTNFIYATGTDVVTNPTTPETAKYQKHAAGRGSLGTLDFTAKLSGGGSVVATGDSDAPILTLPSTMKYETIIAYHGYLMVFSWLLCPFVGIFIARFLKTVLGVWWFRLHSLIMVVGVTIGSITAILLIYLYKVPPHFSSSSSYHPVLGLLITAMLIVQIILGVVADKLWSPDRQAIPWWDKAHWYIGRSLLVLAFINILLGINFYNTLNSAYPIGIIVFTAVVAIGGVGAMVYGQKTYGQINHMKGEGVDEENKTETES